MSEGPADAEAGPAEPSSAGRGRYTGNQVGIAFGFAAYLLWGLFPAFFGLLTFANPGEVLAERILWNLAVALPALFAAGRLRELRGIDARTWRLAAAASLALSIN